MHLRAIVSHIEWEIVIIFSHLLDLTFVLLLTLEFLLLSIKQLTVIDGISNLLKHSHPLSPVFLSMFLQALNSIRKTPLDLPDFLQRLYQLSHLCFPFAFPYVIQNFLHNPDQIKDFLRNMIQI